jgi:hypothetical protein
MNETRSLKFSTWSMIVQDYSLRNLTMPKDKVIAIEGVAESVLRLTGRHYLTGLWVESLHRDLPWAATARPVKALQNSSPHLPSWSWMSVDAEVTFCRDLNLVYAH